MGNNRSKVPDLEKLVKGGRKKFVRYEEGVQLFCNTFISKKESPKSKYDRKSILRVKTE